MKLRVKSEKFRVNSGQSLFEVVMAIAISALIIVAIVFKVLEIIKILSNFYLKYYIKKVHLVAP